MGINLAIFKKRSKIFRSFHLFFYREGALFTWQKERPLLKRAVFLPMDRN
jgi:hypothetical protein